MPMRIPLYWIFIDFGDFYIFGCLIDFLDLLVHTLDKPLQTQTQTQACGDGGGGGGGGGRDRGDGGGGRGGGDGGGADGSVRRGDVGNKHMFYKYPDISGTRRYPVMFLTALDAKFHN